MGIHNTMKHWTVKLLFKTVLIADVVCHMDFVVKPVLAEFIDSQGIGFKEIRFASVLRKEMH